MPFSCLLLKRNNYQKKGNETTLLKQTHGGLLAPLSQSQGFSFYYYKTMFSF